jgi:hypothetical protein
MSFNFKRESKVYLVYSGNRYELDVESDLSFTQTFTEQTTSIKTLHSQDFFERSTIVKANPANFAFSMPILQESDLKVVFDRLLDFATFDLYIQSNESTFKLEKCVLTNGTFVIERSTLLKLTLSGEAKKLSRVGGNLYSVPGVVIPRSGTRRSLKSSEISVSLDSLDITSGVYAISAEIQNEVNWTAYSTVNDVLTVTDRSNAMFPNDFTVQKRTFAGSIGRYLEDGTDNTFLNFDKDVTLRIKAGETISSTLYGFDFNMDSCSLTTRMTSDEVFTQNYDWRLTSNTQTNNILLYNTL